LVPPRESREIEKDGSILKIWLLDEKTKYRHMFVSAPEQTDETRGAPKRSCGTIISVGGDEVRVVGKAFE
jgi:hypothetical protein